MRGEGGMDGIWNDDRGVGEVVKQLVLWAMSSVASERNKWEGLVETLLDAFLWLTATVIPL